MDKVTNTPRFLYPPGGILIWIIVFLEVTVFFAGLLMMKVYAPDQTDIYQQSAGKLNLMLGTLNTIVLLISGYFMAKTLEVFRSGQNEGFRKNLLITIKMGCVFLCVKTIEYMQKLADGYTISFNTFYSFYWMITVFHLLHVLAGMAILLYFYFAKQGNNKTAYQENLEATAVFWHMCDLIWVMVFAVIYLYWR